MTILNNKDVRIVDPKKWTEFVCQEMNYILPEDCRGGTVVDCGSNVGAFEITNKDRFDMYHCFDICNQNIEILKNNLENIKNVNFTIDRRACWKESNQIKNVMAHSNEFGEVNYFGNSGAFSIVEAVNPDGVWGWKDTNTIDTVETISIEEIIEEYGPIKLLKVDIEGSEWDFLYRKDLSKIEFIVGEFHNCGSQKWRELISHIGETHYVVASDLQHVFTFKRR